MIDEPVTKVSAEEFLRYLKWRVMARPEDLRIITTRFGRDDVLVSARGLRSPGDRGGPSDV